MLESAAASCSPPPTTSDLDSRAAGPATGTAAEAAAATTEALSALEMLVLELVVLMLVPAPVVPVLELELVVQVLALAPVVLALASLLEMALVPRLKPAPVMMLELVRSVNNIDITNIIIIIIAGHFTPRRLKMKLSKV